MMQQVLIPFLIIAAQTHEADAPLLLEEYTYIDLKLNVGLTDWDFDTRNDAYGFSRKVGVESLACVTK